MKIFFVGDSPTVDTGFGVVAKNLLTRWQKMGHEIVVQGINEYGDNPRILRNYDFPIYPADKGGPEQVYGLRKVWPNIHRENPDLVFFLNDPWLIKNYMDIKPPEIGRYLKYVAYYPTDAPPIKKEWLEVLNQMDAQVCYSKYAEDVITYSNSNKRPENLYQIYHGVDTNTFFPMDQAYARAKLGIPADLFVIGMVARNQPRKRFDLLMMAFAQFAKGKDDVKLYLHTGLRDIGFDIVDIVKQLDLDNKLIITPDITPNQGVTPEELNLIYNSFDVNALISLGDGFGLPVAESMAVGCPQIVSGHSCLKELVEGHGGLLVKNAALVLNSGGMNTWGGVSDVNDLVKQMNFMYNNPAKRIQMGEDAYRFITQRQFSWDYAAQQFDDIFKKVYHLIGGTGSVNANIQLTDLGTPKNNAQQVQAAFSG